MQRNLKNAPLWSSYMGDPVVRQLLPDFAIALQKRVAALRAAVVDGDAVESNRIAHMIRGSAGSYGYPQVADVAGRIEVQAASGRGLEVVASDVDELASLADAIQLATGSLVVEEWAKSGSK